MLMRFMRFNLLLLGISCAFVLPSLLPPSPRLPLDHAFRPSAQAFYHKRKDSAANEGESHQSARKFFGWGGSLCPLPRDALSAVARRRKDNMDPR